MQGLLFLKYFVSGKVSVATTLLEDKLWRKL